MCAAEGSNEGQVSDQAVVFGQMNKTAGRWFLNEGGRAIWAEIKSDGVRGTGPNAGHCSVPKSLRRSMNMAAEDHLQLAVAFHQEAQGFTVPTILTVHVFHAGQEGWVVHEQQGRLPPFLIERLR